MAQVEEDRRSGRDQVKVTRGEVMGHRGVRRDGLTEEAIYHQLRRVGVVTVKKVGGYHEREKRKGAGRVDGLDDGGRVRKRGSASVGVVRERVFREGREILIMDNKEELVVVEDRRKEGEQRASSSVHHLPAKYRLVSPEVEEGPPIVHLSPTYGGFRYVKNITGRALSRREEGELFGGDGRKNHTSFVDVVRESMCGGREG